MIACSKKQEFPAAQTPPQTTAKAEAFVDPKIAQVTRAIKELRENTREPASFKLVQVVLVTISESASAEKTDKEYGFKHTAPENLTCVLFSGRNGYGGMSREWNFMGGEDFKPGWHDDIGYCSDTRRNTVTTYHDDLTDTVKASREASGK